jgi:PPOX class probable F420-dependent enzyme
MANAPDPLQALQGEKYASMVTFRKSGAAVATPIWFAERDGRLYVMTRSDSGKSKRLRNRPEATMAPCTMRGKVTGPSFPFKVRLLAPEEQGAARDALRRKYLLMRVPWLWSRKNVFYELTPAAQG